MRTGCGHPVDSDARQVCSHLAAGLSQTWSTEQFEHLRHFTGQGLDYVLLCPACSPSAGEMTCVCTDCFVEVAHGARLGTRGSPEILTRPGSLLLEVVEKWRWPAKLLGATPYADDWVGLNDRGEVMLVSPGRIKIFRLNDWGIGPSQQAALSCAGDLLLISPTRGASGVIANLESGEKVLEIGPFPAAFFEQDGRRLLIHGEQLAISDVYSGERLGQLPAGGEPPGGLSVSREGRWLAAIGSPDQPLSSLRIFDLRHWNSPPKELCRRDGYWNSRPCWVGPNRLALFGLGEVDALILPGVRLFDVESVSELPGFVGPEGRLLFDEYLFSLHEGLSVWDIASGERLLHQEGTTPLAYHPQRRLFLSQEASGEVRLSRLANTR